MCARAAFAADGGVRRWLVRNPQLPSGLFRRLWSGRRLMELWFARLRSLGVPGVHLGTFAENTAAIRFFEGCGLAREGVPAPAPGFRLREGGRMHVQWMARTV